MSNLNTELDILRLNNRLKRIISQASDINILYQKVCNAIPENNNIYNFAWIINRQKNKIHYSDNTSTIIDKNKHKECYNKLFNNNKASIITHNDDNCILRIDNTNSLTISAPIYYNDIVIGAIAISVDNKNNELEEFHKEILRGLSDEISHQLHLIKTEDQLRLEKQELIKSNLSFKTITKLHHGSVAIFDFNYNLIYASANTDKLIKDIYSNFVSISDILSDSRIKRITQAAELLLSGEKEKTTLVLDISDIRDYPLIIKFNSSILYNHKKEPENFICTIEDITEESRIENAAKDFEYTYSNIFEKAPVGISILDKDAFIINVNEKEQKIIGYSKEEIIGKHISHFFSEETKKQFKTIFKKFLKNGTIESNIDLIAKNGKIIHAHRIAKGVFNSNNELIKIISHTQDITESHDTQKQLRLLNQAIDQSPSIIAISDKDNKLTYINKKFTEVTGYTPKEVLGKGPNLLKSNYHSEEFYQDLRKKINNGKPWQGKFCNMNNKNELYWEKAEISPFYNSKGKLAGFIKTAEDITELLDIENQLLESNKTYQQIFDLAPTPIIICNNEYIIEMNSAAVAFANGDKNNTNNKELYIGQKTSKYTTPNFEAKTKERKDLMSSKGIALPKITEVLYNSKMEARNVEMISASIRYNNEQAFMLVFEDITDRLNTINKLEESEHKFHSIFKTNPDAIIISRRSDGVIIDVNEGFLLETQYNRSDVIGKTTNNIRIFNNNKDRFTINKTIRNKGEIDNFETTFILKDGKEITGLISARTIKLNEYDALLFVIRNISQQKEMEHELIEAKLKAEENDRLKTAFLANMSHEIRNPMNAIIGFSDLLKEDDLSKDEKNKYIDIIQSKGEDLIVLINDIIDVSKIESGVLEIEENTINLSKLITDVKRNYELNFAKIENLNFIININNHNTCYINGDSTRLHQIFNNLIDNALKFTTLGEISINLIIKNKIAIIEVSDTGIGIPKKYLETIFDRFTQVETKEIISGAGLGLCISKSLIKMMDGQINVESELNIGTKFTISFPIINKENRQIVIDDKTIISKDSFKKIKIIILEKDPVSINFYSSIFKNNISNINFQENIEDLINDKINTDVIILNIYPKSNNTKKNIALIKSNNPNIKIIGIFLDDTYIKEDYGEDISIIKPFIKETLLKKIIYLVEP